MKKKKIQPGDIILLHNYVLAGKLHGKLYVYVLDSQNGEYLIVSHVNHYKPSWRLSHVIDRRMVSCYSNTRAIPLSNNTIFVQS